MRTLPLRHFRMRPRSAVRAGTWLLLGPAMLGVCSSGVAQTGATQPPVLTGFAINGGAETVVRSDEFVSLDHTVVGSRPSDYRVSHRADFSGAEWVPYTSAPRMKDWNAVPGDVCDANGTSRRITLFFQVRAPAGMEMRIVDGRRVMAPSRAESNVLRDTICARSADEHAAGLRDVLQATRDTTGT
jgi:hypothetical protein